MYQIVFLRHGESLGNAAGIIQGQADFPLSEKGINQARVLAKYWQDKSRTFDLIISSPLIRAMQTASPEARAGRPAAVCMSTSATERSLVELQQQATAAP